MQHVVKKRGSPDEYVCGNPNENPTGSSYTRDLRLAKVFPTYQAAMIDCCTDNELAMPLDIEMRYYRPIKETL